MSGRADASGSAFWGNVDDTEARERYQALVNAIGDGIYQLDTDGHFVAVNDVFVELTGYRREELLGEHVSAHLDDEDGPVIERALDRIRTDPSERGAPLELAVRTAEGGRVPCEVRLNAFESDGTPQGSIGVVRELTERERSQRDDSEPEQEGIRERSIDSQRTVTALEAAREGISLLDEDGEFVYVNDAYAEMFGYEPGEMIGERWHEFGIEADPGWFRDEVLSKIGEDGQWTESTTCVRSDGSRFRGRHSLVSTGDGELICLVRDATERKERERELDKTIADLRESEDRLQLALEAGEMGTWMLDLRTGSAPARSAQHDRIFGYEERLDDWGFETFLEHVHPDDRERVEQRFESAYETGTWEFECRIVRADGEQRWISARGKFHSDADGEPVRAVGIVRDITEQKEREQRLHDAKSQIEAAAEAGAVGTWEWHVPEDRFVADASLARKFGIDPEEAREGVSLDRLVSSIYEGDRERVEREIEAAVESCGEYETEYRVWNADDELRWVVARGHVECDENGDAVNFPGALTDITERKEYQREIERSERRYRTLVENFPNGSVGMFDEELRYTVVGGQLLDRLDLSPGDRTGESIYEVHSDELIEDIEPYFHAALDGEMNSFEIEYRGRNLYAHTLPVRNSDDEVFAGMIVVQDVTERREAQRELRESEAKFRMLAENLEEIVWMATADAEEFLYINPAFEEVWGLDRGELYRDPMFFLDSVHPDDRERVREAFGALPERDFDEEFRIHRPDGEVRWVHARGARVHDEGGEMTRIVGIGEDVTERIEREREIERSERRYRTVVENFPNGAVGLVDEDLRYVTVGGSPLTERDLRADDLEGRPVRDVLSPELADRLAPMYQAALDGESTEMEHEGDERYTRFRAFPVRDDDGSVFGAMGISQDITEQVERERELERALDLLERTERIADVGGWEIDPATQEVFWTDHIFELLEVDADEEPPLDEALDMYHESDRHLVEDAVEQALASGEPFDVEVRLRTAASGEVRWLRLQGVPETVDGEVVSFRGAAQDVTERKQREQRLEELIDRLEESNERLEQFAYAASHDLQEPLRMVSSYLQLIEQRYAGELDEDGREFINFAVDGANRMRDMIEGLLQYSRVDTRGDAFDSVDMDAVFADARDDLQVRVDETSAEITADELPRVEGDGDQLRQVFQNLLDNAIEYSGDEPPHVYVSAERDGDWWEISVTDEGIGIDPEDTDRVFEVFQSLHSHDDHSGTGIGLALCERIVERHGGDIWVDSEPGEGSTFTFTLPTEGEHSARP